MGDMPEELEHAISNVAMANASTATKSNPGTQEVSGEPLSPHDTVGIHANVAGRIVRTLNDSSQETIPDPASDPASARLYLPTARYPVRIPLLCVGAAGWGNQSRVDSDEEQVDLESLRPALAAVQEATGGLCFVDTHPGRSEDVVGKLIAGLPSRESFVIQARYYAGGDEEAANLDDASRGSAQDPLLSLRDTLARLGGLEFVDVYLLHIQDGQAVRNGAAEKLVRQMAECVEQGLARVVGIAGSAESLGPETVRELDNELAKYNIPLATCVPEWNLAHRGAVSDDMVAACRDVGAVLQAGTMVSQPHMTGEDVRSVSGLLGKTAEIAERRGVGGDGAAMATALNYVLCKGAVPTLEFGDEKGARDLVRALGWRLDDKEMREIEEVYA